MFERIRWKNKSTGKIYLSYQDHDIRNYHYGYSILVFFEAENPENVFFIQEMEFDKIFEIIKGE